jgi:dTDP-4-amino-4,6-dideoxygalactose transaminase
MYGRGMALRIPFNKPFFAGRELDYIAQAVAQGDVSGNGPFTRRCARLLEERLGIARVMLTPSCTAALEMAAMLCNLGPADEVIMPSYTFVSTASAVVRLGAKPVFVDIRRETLNLDETLVEAAITDRTRAIVPVHYAGVPCEMTAIMRIAARHGLFVVEDAAQAVDSRYRGRAAGGIGHLGTFSFHETKNFMCGEGGALCINDPALAERAEILRDKGTNRQRFLNGQVDKYTWVDVGSSYVPSEVCSAFLCAQLEEMERISARRRRCHRFYATRLADLRDRGLLQLPTPPEGCTDNAHMFWIVVRDQGVRDALLAHLKALGILAVFHYVPLHSSPMGRRHCRTAGPLPVTEDISGRLIRLPLYFDLTEPQQEEVVDAIGAFFSASSRSTPRPATVEGAP